MPQDRTRRWLAIPMLLLAAALAWPEAGPAGLAGAQTAKPEPGTASKRPPPQVRHGTQGLPRPVLDMREAMLNAIESGDIEELRHAWNLSEPKPDVGAPAGADPIAHWKRISGDGHGREVLAALSLILDAGYAVLPLGPDIENNRLYVWPYFAAWPLDELTPRQEVEILRLVPPAALRDMKRKGKFTSWRLVIGADGTWHALRKAE